MIAYSSNFTKGRKSKIEFIVIHYTGNNGDTAKDNCNYFKKANRNVSAHYFVDENVAWHCGTKSKYYHIKCRNSNSIGVEICSEKDKKGNFYFNEKTLNNAINFVKFFMKKYNIPIENILRHYDITHKICPAPFVNDIVWNNFKNKLKEVDYMKVKRAVEFNGVKKELNAINDNGKNYYSIVDILALIGRKVSYDKDTKITKIF